MRTTEMSKHYQCPGFGCAAGLMRHLRSKRVELCLVDGDGFYALCDEPDGVAAVAAHNQDLEMHEDRIFLILLSELGGRN
jgi:hypothetical protein